MMNDNDDNNNRVRTHSETHVWGVNKRAHATSSERISVSSYLETQRPFILEPARNFFLKNVIGSLRMMEQSDRCGRHTQAHILISGSLPGAPPPHPPSMRHPRFCSNDRYYRVLYDICTKRQTEEQQDGGCGHDAVAVMRVKGHALQPPL